MYLSLSVYLSLSLSSLRVSKITCGVCYQLSENIWFDRLTVVLLFSCRGDLDFWRRWADGWMDLIIWMDGLKQVFHNMK